MLAVTLQVVSPSTAVADRRVALVVGNSSYRYIPRLDNPANDARLMADTLRTPP
ncbi:caspase family protein [Bradyrhizobium sp. ISRA430]|uniref:caspase family protein n=1 Tax=unclassified Bradyrhizobium TaxID=2631580 RepID=UPI0032AFF30F